MKKVTVMSLVLFFAMLLSSGSSVQANEGNKDTLYSVYTAAKMRMTVDEVRDIVKRLSPQDVKSIPESLEQSGDSTSGMLEIRLIHRGNKNDDFSDIYLTLLFTSEGYNTPLVLVCARWEKRTHGGTTLEYVKRKGR